MVLRADTVNGDFYRRVDKFGDDDNQQDPDQQGPLNPTPAHQQGQGNARQEQGALLTKGIFMRPGRLQTCQ